MLDKEIQIAEAAARVISRYGIKRTTMADVAEEAGVARQTIYNVFPNKNALIHGMTLHYLRNQLEKSRAAWAEAKTLPEQLDILFEFNVFEPWEMTQALPDAHDLEKGDHAAAKSAMELAGADMRASMIELFEPYAAPLRDHGQTPEGMASFVQATMIGLKHSTDNRATLDSLIGTLKAMALHVSGKYK